MGIGSPGVGWQIQLQHKKPAPATCHLHLIPPDTYLLIVVSACSYSTYAAATFRTSNSEVVVVENGIEQKEKLALCLVAPHRISSKHDDVPLAHWYVNHGGFVYQF